MITLPAVKYRIINDQKECISPWLPYRRGMGRKISSYPMTSRQGPSQDLCHFSQQYLVFLHREADPGVAVFQGAGECSKMEEYQENKIRGVEKIKGTCSRC